MIAPTLFLVPLSTLQPVIPSQVAQAESLAPPLAQELVHTQ